MWTLTVTAFAIAKKWVDCTDELACNYDASATDEDGSCTYCGCETATANFDGYNVIVEPHVVHTSGDLAWIDHVPLVLGNPERNRCGYGVHG